MVFLCFFSLFFVYNFLVLRVTNRPTKVGAGLRGEHETYANREPKGKDVIACGMPLLWLWMWIP